MSLLNELDCESNGRSYKYFAPNGAKNELDNGAFFT
jgi:hypothetical protein